MRRRNRCAARSFYQRHEHVEFAGSKDNSSYNDEGAGIIKDRRGSSLRSRAVVLLRAVLSFILDLASAVRACAEATFGRLKRCLGRDVDLAECCVACSRRFTVWGSVRRRKCANCLNDFCDVCLDKRHEIFDGQPGSAGAKRPVCAYCFFTLCARHCMARCCADLPARDLKGFLARKGVSSRTALEKSDLVDLIHNWSLDLDAAARQQHDSNCEDLEVGRRERRQESSYSATSAHLTVNEMEGPSKVASGAAYSSLGIQELRHLLTRRGIDTSGCIEKTELVRLLVHSDGAKM